MLTHLKKDLLEENSFWVDREALVINREKPHAVASIDNTLIRDYHSDSFRHMKQTPRSGRQTSADPMVLKPPMWGRRNGSVVTAYTALVEDHTLTPQDPHQAAHRCLELQLQSPRLRLSQLLRHRQTHIHSH